MLEQEIIKSILSWLEWKHIFHYRNNSGAVFAENKGKKRFFRFGAAGSPDIVCVVNGQYIGVEVKSLIGKQSPAQHKWEKELTRAGGIYLLIHSLQELENLGIFNYAKTKGIKKL